MVLRIDYDTVKLRKVIFDDICMTS